MKRQSLIITLMLLALGDSAFAFDLGFKAPAVNGTANATSPELGAIVLDTSSNIFYGNIGSPSSPSWSAFNGSGSSLPSGSVIAFGGAAAPSGFLICDGSAVSRTTYAALFAAIGTSFGAGDGSTTFNLPDLRGRFIRGTDNGAGNDPDAGTRTAMASGGATGDNVGSLQADAMQGHIHGTPIGEEVGAASPYNQTTGGGGAAVNVFNSGDPITDGTNGTPRFTSETRPTNGSLNYIIKI